MASDAMANDANSAMAPRAGRTTASSRQKPPFASVDQAEAMAKRHLPRFLYDMVEGASGPLTNRANVRAFDQIGFHPKAAVVCEDRDLHTTILGNELSLPVMLACPGGARLLRPEGEKAVAAAAGRAGTINIVSMSTGHPLEAVAAAGAGPLWQQLYLSRGRDGAEEVIERAKAAGYQALTITVDLLVTPTPVIAGARLPSAGLNAANLFKFAGQTIQRPGWLISYLLDHLGERGVTDIERLGVTPGGPETRIRSGTLVNKMTATWEDFKWIRDQWGGPIVAKGILTADDARRAVDAGCSAIVVSNHGAAGMIDTFPTSLRMLPEIAEAVGSQCDVLLDSGVRSGAHVVKALALGAKAVLLGRPYLYGLAAAGEAGVYEVLQIFKREIDAIMGAIGCKSVRDLNPSYVIIPDIWPRWDPGL